MNKKVLILDTDNASLSIIAQAVLNRYLHRVEASSAGIKASSKINPIAKKVLISDGSWDESYYSKSLNEVSDTTFDLVVILSDITVKKLPDFSYPVQIIHVGYEEVQSKNEAAFSKTLKLIQMELTPIVRMELGL